MSLLPALLLLVACGFEGPAADTSNPGDPSSAGAPRSRKLTLAAYTTPREVFGRSILPAFAASWKQKTGEIVTFEESYQGSGAQARAVVGGLEADVVALSLDPDVQTIHKAGLITSDWHTGPHGGMVTTSLAVIATRTGNPKGIRDWSDLARPDVEVLTPNVRTSGGAMWNVLGIWGAAARGHGGGMPVDLLAGVLGRVSVMDKGARESIVNFEKGVGDVAITYENEVFAARREGQLMDYVVPPSTILIESPAAVVDVFAKKHGVEDLARAFVDFLVTPEAQRAFAEFGFRPVDPSVAVPGLPNPEDLFTIRDLGGWDEAKKAVFDEGAGYDKALAQARSQGGK